ncbi:MAG: protein kinase [Chlorobi bacterium OLB7]|nr:MAG: protein kinase [Chlorobi bacterium OLB7]
MTTNQNDTEPKTYPWRNPPQPEPAAPQGPASVPTATEENDRIPWAKLLKYLLIGIVGMFLLLMLFDKLIMPWYVKLGDVETVPNVVGLSFDSAKVKLEERGFEVRKGESRNDDTYPAGTVAQQLPYGGAETKHGRRVYLTISLGTEMIPMPNMIGMQVREARINLMRAGLDIGEITYEYNDTIMRDLIFSQSIPPQVGARPGSLINVMVSRGPTTRYTLMPSLVSLDVEQARTRLENAGLVLGVVRYKEDGSWAPNIVLEQAVAPYAKVAERAAVDIVVAAAPGSMGPTPQGDESAAETEDVTVRNIDQPEEKGGAAEKKK